MKKLLALMIVTAVIAGTTGCASDGKKDKNTSDESQSSVAEEKTYAQKYNDFLQSRDFSITLTDKSELMPENTMIVNYKGDDLSVEQKSDTYNYKMYMIDGKIYYFDSATMNYSVTDGNAQMGDFSPIETCYGIGEDYELQSSETKNGLICETYTYVDKITQMYDSSGSDSTKETSKYYFDEKTGELVKIEREAYGTQVVITVDSISHSGEEVALPSLEDWVCETDITEDPEGGVD